MQSENINELAAALAKAQGAITCAIEDKVNPHFKSSYASLHSVWDACRKPLSDNGLSVIQVMEKIDGKNFLKTILAHSSGQWIDSMMEINFYELSPQKLGCVITYFRRYSLASMIGIAPGKDDDGDDDGNTAEKAYKKPEQKECITPQQAEIIKKMAVVANCEERFLNWLNAEYKTPSFDKIKCVNYDYFINLLQNEIKAKSENMNAQI